MTFLFYLVAGLLALTIAAYVLTRANAGTIAGALRMIVPAVLFVAAVTMTVTGKTGLGVLLLVGSVSSYRALARKAGVKTARGQTSRVRTAALEMELDHDTGDLDGYVLAGSFEGVELAELSSEQLLDLRGELASDTESLQLLEAYLDRRIPGWRDGADTNGNAGQGASSGSGSMTKQEAYQILGLEEGASVADIRKAHRNLMQRVHPDRGGSSFLAARINQAKDLLLTGH